MLLIIYKIFVIYANFLSLVCLTIKCIFVLVWRAKKKSLRQLLKKFELSFCAFYHVCIFANKKRVMGRHVRPSACLHVRSH